MSTLLHEYIYLDREQIESLFAQIHRASIDTIAIQENQENRRENKTEASVDTGALFTSFGLPSARVGASTSSQSDMSTSVVRHYRLTTESQAAAVVTFLI